MMQRHIILMNERFSASTEVPESSLIVMGGYQVNGPPGLGGGIVNSSSVRQFLNDDVNEYIINDFFSYLTGSTNTQEFAEIFHSDQKLSNVFNDYYISTVVGNQIPSTSVIDASLTGSTPTTVIRKDIFNYNGYNPFGGLNNIPQSINNSTRKEYAYDVLDTFTDEESYYVPVFIKRTSRYTPVINVQSCDNKTSVLINGGEFTFNSSGDLFVGDIIKTPVIFGGESPLEGEVLNMEPGKLNIGNLTIINP